MKKNKKIKPSFLDKFSFFISSLGFVGFFKFAPGTIGSIFSFIFIVPIIKYYGTMGLCGLIIATFIIGYFAIKKVLQFTEHDPSFIVIDELLGQAITFLFVGKLVPFTKFNFMLGFILFRIFDITKPWVIGIIDKKIKNSLGVLLDDLFAGLLAGICLFIANLLLNIFSLV